jgi:cation transport regulator
MFSTYFALCLATPSAGGEDGLPLICLKAKVMAEMWHVHHSTPRRRELGMPYRTNDDLPVSVRAHLPDHAQDIYREAFNHYAAHAGDVREEEAAHRIAWAAVKRSYVKAGGSWIARGARGAR